MTNITKLSSAALLALMIGISAPAFSKDTHDHKENGAHKECDPKKDKNCKDDHHDEKSQKESGKKADHDHKDGDEDKTPEKTKN